MSEFRVIDTNVIIGLVLKYDEHHENSREYIENAPSDVILPPTAHDEFNSKIPRIRSELSNEILSHQSDLIQNFPKGKLSIPDLKHARDQLVDPDTDIADSLKDYYDRKISEYYGIGVYRMEIEKDLSDMDMEVDQDASRDIGGWQNLISVWTRATNPNSYRSLRNSLLIKEGKDPKICTEAHHIAKEFRPDPTDLGTADGDFIDKKPGEHKPRNQDIIDRTELRDIIDLRATS